MKQQKYNKRKKEKTMKMNLNRKRIWKSQKNRIII